MELVYLWVEEYKNIKNQGFNFSPRFRCEYDPDTNELTIEENDDYIENFFGENINVTAIVGKNGSGKSSVLDILRDCEKSNKYIFCYISNGENIYSTNISSLYIKSSLDFIEKIEVELELMVFSSDYLTKNKNLNIDLSEENISSILIEDLKNDFLLESFMFVPYKIYIKQNQSYMDDLLDSIKPNPVVRNNSPAGNNDFDSIHNERDNFETNNILEAFFFADMIEHELSDDLGDDDQFFNVNTLQYNIDYLEQCYNSSGLNDANNFNIEEFNSIFDKTEFIKNDFNIGSHNLIDKYHDFLSFDFEDTKGRKYSDLSYGEKVMFGQLINIHYFLKDISSPDFLLLLDEPEISLHPQWQKYYMKEILSMLDKIGKKVQLLCTTHSPFLLSDIPKQNIIFLDTDEAGKCKVVDGLKEKKQTFGANIHTLLSDSFFMEDGLMGEFAKGKIEEVIHYLNNQESPIENNDEAQKLIDIIGEPIIRNQLQKMLDSKRLSKIDEIDSIKQEIKNLQNRMKEIEDADDKS